MKNPSTSYLKIGQAAKALGVSIDTLRRWEKAGKITAIRTPGGTRLYHVSALKEVNPSSVEHFQTSSLSTEELLRKTSEQNLHSSVILNASEGSQDFESTDSSPAEWRTQNDNLKRSFISRFLIGSAILSIITLLLTSWITASYLTNPNQTQQFFKNNVASGLFLPFQTLAQEAVAVLDPRKAKELGFVPPDNPPPIPYALNTNPSSNVLAVTASPQFLEVNADTQINGSLSVRDAVNGLTLEATPSSSTIGLTSGNTTLTITKTAKLDQDVSTTATPSFNTLNLTGTKNQMVFQSGGPAGTLTWTPTAARTLTLPDVTDTLVGKATTDTLTNKSMSGSSNTFTSIPNSALSNNKVTVTAGTNLTGGGDISLGSSATLSLIASPSVTGDLTVGGIIAANGGTISTSASSLGFTDGTNTLFSIIDKGTYGFIRLSDKGATGDPATCTAGDVYFNGTDGVFKACTATNTWANLTAGSGGITGYWNRTGTTLSPATAGDAVTTSGNISTSGSGTITSASTLTASNGLTLTTGALNLTATSGSAALTLNSSTTAFNVNSGIFDIDTSNSRVGIGTAAPTQKLTLAGGNFLQTAVTTPTIKGTIDDDTNLKTGRFVKIQGKYAYTVSRNAAGSGPNFSIIDISNPASPAIVSTLEDSTNLVSTNGIAVQGKYAYVANGIATAGKKDFAVIDISNPKSPSIVGTIEDKTNLYVTGPIAVQGKYAYVVSGNENVAGKKEFTVVDISNPTAPAVVGSIDDDTSIDYGIGIFVQGKYAYVISFNVTAGKKNLAIIDISNPANPTVVGSLEDKTNLYRPRGIFVSGKYAYTVDYQQDGTKAGFTVINVSDPTTPSITTTITDNTNFYQSSGIYAAGRYAYVTAAESSVGKNNFVVVDISDPTAPTVTASLDDNTNLYTANSLTVSGKYAYVINDDSTASQANFAVVDISGIDVPTGNIGDLAAGTLNVWDNMSVANNLSIGGGLNIGSGGLFSAGTLAANLPAQTNTGTNTSAYKGLTITAGALVQNTGAGTDTFSGADIATPNITQTTGTITSNGVLVTTGSITTGGTQNGLNIAATGVGAGTLNGLNISNITGSGGSETAVQIGSGWDNAIKFVGASNLDIPDNTASALTISQGANNYLLITTTDNSEIFTLDLPAGGATSLTGNLFTSNIAKTINIGTGTAADTINIGTGGTTADIIHIGDAATANTITIGSASSTGVSITDDNWSISTGGAGVFTTLAATPGSNATALTLTGTNVTSANLAYLNAKNTSGTILNLAYGASATLTGDLIGQAIDLNNGQLTNSNYSVTGLKVTLPTVTDSNTTGTTNILGFQFGFGTGSGINQTGAGATIYSGVDITLPAITQTAGTLTANGVSVTTSSSITSGGTANGVKIIPYSNGSLSNAGTLNGLNIGGITTAGASVTENAILIGSNWDSVLKVGSTTIINGSGVTQVAGGGTGIASYTAGDLIYASDTTTLLQLAGGTGNNGKILTITAGVPTWASSVGGGICADCVLNDPTSVTTQTITPNNQDISSLVVRQTTYATPTQNIFEVTNKDNTSKFFYVDKDGNVSTGAISNTTLTLTPTTNTTALTLVGTNVTTQPLQYINAKNSEAASGIFKLAYGAAQTLSTSVAVTGILEDLATNVTATDATVKGVSISLPGATNTANLVTNCSDSNCPTIKGLVISGASINNTGTSTTTFTGADITIPPITQTAGTLTGNGVLITTPTITTGGTANAINIAASGIAVGTLNGINISTITGGSGTETALNIGAGWDTGIAIGGAGTTALWLSSAADNTTAANGITFGLSKDTNLYRSAADTLKTDDSLIVGGTLTPTTLATPYQHTIIVAKAGGDYTTITAALNAITDNDSTHLYLIKVMPGSYSEQVTMKQYVDIIGAGKEVTTISQTDTTTGVVIAASNARMEGFTLNNASVAGTSRRILALGSASPTFKNIKFTTNKISGESYVDVSDIITGSPVLDDIEVIASGFYAFIYPHTAASGTLTLRNSRLNGLTMGVNGSLTFNSYFNDYGGAGTYSWQGTLAPTVNIYGDTNFSNISIDLTIGTYRDMTGARKYTDASGSDITNKVVYLSAADTVNLADADDTTKIPAIGVVVEDNGGTVWVKQSGSIYDATAPWVAGSTYYLSKTAGEITTDPGASANAQIIGVARSTKELKITLDTTGAKSIYASTSSPALNLTQTGAKTAADYGLYLANTSTSSTASINKYGEYISSTGTWNGTTANNYGLYIDTISGGTSNFGLAIAAAGTQTLVLSADADNTTAAAGIAFGLSRDTNLYRSAADTLKTDDAFIAGGGINGTSVGASTASTGAFTTLSATPAGNSTALTLTGTNVTSANLAYFNAENTSGTIFNLAYGAPATLAGALTGQAIDLSTNVTNAAQSVTGTSITLPVTTAASTTTLKGISLSGGAFTTAAAATTSTWTGLDLTMPNITKGAGSTLTSTGIKITGGTVTSGTSYALTTDANAGNVGIGITSPAAQLDILTPATTTGFNLAGTAPASVAGNGTNAATNTLAVVGTAGGASSGVTGQTGGTGGILSLTGGVGGAVVGASGIGGVGGGLTLAGGAGGAGATTGGVGGTISITAGAAGTGGNANGGTLTLNSGAVTGTGTSTINLGSLNTTNLNIGNNTGATSLALTSGTGSQTYTSSVVSGTTTTSAFVFNASALTTGTALYLTSTATSGKLLDLNATQTSGTISNLAYGAAATLAGALTGQAIDLSTNVTNAAQSVTGTSITLPVTTAASTTTLKGISLSGGAFTTAAAATTSTWTGLDLTMPNITKGAGSTLTSTGIKITGGTVTSGTSYALITDANAGNVGIGVAAPAASLDILSTGTGLKVVSSNNDGSTPTIKAYNSANTGNPFAEFYGTNGTTVTGRLSMIGTSESFSVSAPATNGRLFLAGGSGGSIRMNTQVFVNRVPFEVYNTDPDSTTVAERIQFDFSSNLGRIFGMQGASGTARALSFGTNNTEAFRIDTSQKVGIGITAPGGLLDVSKALSGTPSTTGPYLSLSASTFTDNNTAASGTAASMVFNSIAAPTLAATNATVTTTDAATLYIAGPPTAGTNETITNAYALWTTGNVRIGAGSLCVKSTDAACAGADAGKIYATTTTLQAADLAENYISSEDLEPGDLVAPAGDGNNSAIIKSSGSYQKQVLGVISTNPGVTLNSDAVVDPTHPNLYPVALSGRVPVKVSTENGSIGVGDYLTSSSTPGIAMKATQPGQVIGKALEEFTGDSGQGTDKIMVFVSPGFADPGNFLASLTLDNAGNLIMPNIKLDKLTVTSEIKVDGKLLVKDTSALDGVANSAYTDLAQKESTTSAQVADLTNQVASASAEIASASAQIASAKSDLAKAQSDINDLKLTPPDILMATGSATLANLKVTSEATVSGMLVAYQAEIQDNFKVLGSSTLGNTLIAGDLTVDGTMSINGSSINNLGILYIQNSYLAEGVDFFNGKITIDKDGNITAQGQIAASEVKTNKLTISNTPIATSSATLAASIGTATLTANTASVTIQTTGITDSAKVFITPVTATDKVLSVTNVQPGVSFDVSVLSPATSDIKFNWWIVQTE